MSFLRDVFEQPNASLRRRVRDNPSFVGAMLPVDPSALSTGVNAGASLLSGLKNFFTGDFIGAIKDASRLGVLGGEHIGNSSIAGPVERRPVLFQYYPESISDTRQNNFESVSPPGLSLPIPTLASASPRTITITVIFSQERWAGPGRRIDNWDKYNFDVATSLQAIRMFAYPIGSSVLGIGNAGITPQPFILTLPGSMIGINSDSIAAILRQYAIEYVSFFPDGQPRLARATLSMEEILLSLSDNVTGVSFNNAASRQFNQAIKAVEKREVQDQAPDKGMYGVTKQPDVSNTNTVPPT